MKVPARGLVHLLWVSIVLGSLGSGCGPKATATDSTPIPTSEDPIQEPPTDKAPLRLSKGGWECTLTPLATYTLRGVVLHRENYSSGWNGALSPCDVAMAWGPLVAGQLWRKVSWSQTSRWYFWEYDSDFPYDETFVARYSCNAHILPANKNLARAARGLGSGDTAELVGELVSVDAKRGLETASWSSSTTRQDTGDGSCEVLYLRRLKVDGKVYE